MKNKIAVIFICLLSLLAGCSSEEELIPEKETITKSANFPTMKWWAYFPRYVKKDSYTVANGPDGVNWPGLYTSFRFFPEYIHAVYYNDEIVMVYVLGGRVYLHRSPDGMNWSASQDIHVGAPTAPDGQRNYPRMAIVNGELFVYNNHTSTNPTDQYMRVYNHNKGYVYPSAYLGSSTQRMSPPCFATLNGLYYIFYVDPSGSKSLKYMTSMDGIRWSAPTVALTNSTLGNDISATTLNGSIYITHRRTDNHGLAYIRYNGSYFTSYTNINNYKTTGTNLPIATDGEKLVISFRDGTNTANRFVYSRDGVTWHLINAPGSSHVHHRVLVYTGE